MYRLRICIQYRLHMYTYIHTYTHQGGSYHEGGGSPRSATPSPKPKDEALTPSDDIHTHGAASASSHTSSASHTRIPDRNGNTGQTTSGQISGQIFGNQSSSLQNLNTQISAGQMGGQSLQRERGMRTRGDFLESIRVCVNAVTMCEYACMYAPVCIYI